MRELIPYGYHTLEEDDIQAVVSCLRSGGLLTGGEYVTRFEEAFARYVGAKYAVAVSSGTAALHVALMALGVGPGDEVIVSAITFAATANAVVYCGATPVFADVEADTLCMDMMQAASLINPKTKVILPMDYAGQPCDYSALNTMVVGRKSWRQPIYVMVDACHALGSRYQIWDWKQGEHLGRFGGWIDAACYSFHPVKHITSGEGGMVVTDGPYLATQMRSLRNHGGAGQANMTMLGYNYRLPDAAAAMGINQLKKLPRFLERRRQIAEMYDKAFADMETVTPLKTRQEVEHAYHLYVLCIDTVTLDRSVEQIRAALATFGVGSQRHYRPVHLQSYYLERFGTKWGMCPVAEQAYEQILSIPIFPTMTDEQVQQVIDAVRRVCG